MDGIRRVLDANKLAILRGKVTFLDSEWRAHKHMCADCSLYTDIARRSCDEGWTMVKQLAAANNALDRYVNGDRKESAGTQMEMFL
jgi:hypothetical protein